MSTVEIFFRTIDNSSVPYIVDQETTEYVCDGKEGSVCFDGYYYVEDHAPPYPEDDALQPWKRPRRNDEWLPKILKMYMKRYEKEPRRTEVSEKGVTSLFYHTLEEHFYTIEIYKRTTHASTDRISEEEDEHGLPMSICFFPTNKQTIYFRVLETH
jgi:hypothetical protein